MNGPRPAGHAGRRGLLIRDETPQDADAIRRLVADAFAGQPYSDGTEHRLVDALRQAGALTLSLVAEAEDGGVAGHVAFSPVRIDGRAGCWYGLAPLAVRPDRQRGGIGQALVRSGLARMDGLGAAGCVVLGSPAYYVSFGFAARPQLRLDGVPPDHFMALAFDGPVPAGTVTFHDAFAMAA